MNSYYQYAIENSNLFSKLPFNCELYKDSNNVLSVYYSYRFDNGLYADVTVKVHNNIDSYCVHFYDPNGLHVDFGFEDFTLCDLKLNTVEMDAIICEFPISTETIQPNDVGMSDELFNKLSVLKNYFIEYVKINETAHKNVL